MGACMISHFSHVRLFVILWTVARQAPLSMGFSRQEYWSGWLCPPPGDLPDRTHISYVSCLWQAGSLPLALPWGAQVKYRPSKKYLYMRGESDSKNTILCKIINNLLTGIDFSILILFLLFVILNHMLDMSCLSLQIPPHPPLPCSEAQEENMCGSLVFKLLAELQPRGGSAKKP